VVKDFSPSFAGEAAELARVCYEREREHVPALPEYAFGRDVERLISELAGNGLGVAAFEDGRLTGFLCCTQPFLNSFCSTDAVGVFSPMCCNGVTGEDSGRVWGALYHTAAPKWADAGAASHAVALFAHDRAGQEAFYRSGFGLRCVDAVRTAEPLGIVPSHGYNFCELQTDELKFVCPLDKMLNMHMAAAPIFLKRELRSPQEGARYFGAFAGGDLVAFLQQGGAGENLAAERMENITGAFCLHGHRRRGVSAALLDLAARTLRDEGHLRIGVDFESFNPEGSGFWLRHFTAYTHSVVRRIDERALDTM